MSKILSKYINAFEKLRVDRTHGVAPHKPILLLSVLQSVYNGIQTSSRTYLSPELVALFKSNWNSLVTTKHECRISYPFYHLKSSKFWRLIPKHGYINIDTLSSAVKNLANLDAAIEYALLDDELFDLIKEKENNLILQRTLLDKFFSHSKENYTNSTNGQETIFSEIENKILNEPAAEYRDEIKQLLVEKNDDEVYLRGSMFKREIPKIYNNICCISGMRIDATINISMIDACHIVPFSVSYDDTVSNGIALCPNLHRAFDRGLIGIDENYQVIISKTFKEDNTNYSIKHFEGLQIRLPNLTNYYPLKENFEWHRKNIFK